MKTNTFTLLLLALCCAAGAAQARDIYVAPTGNDASGAGTLASPYATVQRAINASAAGDVIFLRGGTYAGNVTVNKPNLTLRSYAGERALISSPTANSAVAQTVWFTASGGRVLDLDLVGGYFYALKFETGNAVVRGCKISGSGRDCVKIVPGADDITIQQCEIYNSGQRDPSNAEGIDNVNGDRMRVQDCYIHDIATYGLYPKGGAIGCVIERCLVTNCGAGGIMLGGYTDDEFFDPVQNPGWYENIDGTVRNCIVVNTQGGGVSLYAALRPQVYNNTLVNVAAATHAGIVSDLVPHAGANRFTTSPTLINNIVALAASSSRQVVDFRNGVLGTATLSNNRYHDAGGAGVFRNNGVNYTLAAWKTQLGTDANSTEGNPGLAANQHLAAGSACINAGATLATVRDDYDGAARTGAYDIGADESGACAPLAVPPPAGTIGTGVSCSAVLAVAAGAPVSEAEAISVYPNPVSGVCRVQFLRPFSRPAVRLTDLQGRQVSVRYEQDAAGITVHTDHLASGVYCLHVQAENGAPVQQKIAVAK